MRWKPYPEYKDSGVEWLGKIPVDWGTKRLKYCCATNMGQSPSSEEYDSDNHGLPFLQGCADFGGVSPNPKQFCNTPRKMAKKGDILISVRAPVGTLNIADRDYGIGRGLCAVRPREVAMNPNYAWYLLHEVRSQLAVVSTGSTYDAVSAEDVGNITCVLPPLDIQRAIAAFLDRETARIDALIAKIRDSITTLREYRTALISAAVTGKIDVRGEVAQ